MYDLTEKQEAIVETAAEHPDASSTTIANIVDNDYGVDVSPSYVRQVCNDYESDIEMRREKRSSGATNDESVDSVDSEDSEVQSAIHDLESTVETAGTETVDTTENLSTSVPTSGGSTTSATNVLEDMEENVESDDEPTSLFDRLLSLIGL